MAEFVCGVREKNPNYLSACKNLPEYQETSYCVLHFPGEEKKEDFEQVGLGLGLPRFHGLFAFKPQRLLSF